MSFSLTAQSKLATRTLKTMLTGVLIGMARVHVDFWRDSVSREYFWRDRVSREFFWRERVYLESKSISGERETRECF